MIVIVESPYAGDTDLNHAYAVRACADCFRRREVPFASHLMYPAVLDELKPEERERGITAGYEFWPLAEKIVFYCDRGMSPGMIRAWHRAGAQEREREQRWMEIGKTLNWPGTYKGEPT